MIEVRDITKRFDTKQALRNVSFTINKGDLVALLGLNGAGKTTLIRILATLTRPNEGQARVDGIDIIKQPNKIRPQIGLIGHYTLLYQDLTAEENLLYYSKMYSIPKALQRIEDLLHKVDLWDRRYERVRTFSRGMQQRLSLARAILHDPDILLLDEPFTGLDITAIDNLTAILDSSVRHGRTVIFTTHDIHYALGNAKRALILQKGVLVEDKKTHQLSLDKMDTLLGVQPRLNTKELY